MRDDLGELALEIDEGLVGRVGLRGQDQLKREWDNNSPAWGCPRPCAIRNAPRKLF